MSLKDSVYKFGSKVYMATTKKQNQEDGRFELYQPGKYGEYLLHTKAEILSVLRHVIQHKAMITIHFDPGNSFFLSSLIAITPDDQHMILDVSADTELNHKVLKANKLTFTAFIERVKIQFNSAKMIQTTHEGHNAFLADFPDTLLRLQRRDAFRLAVPAMDPVYLHAELRQTGNSILWLDIPLWDISCGGVGLTATTVQAEHLSKGDVLTNCRIALSGEGIFIATICIKYVTAAITQRSGQRSVRIGCEFMDMPPSQLKVIQRYITRIERERNARTIG